MSDSKYFVFQKAQEGMQTEIGRKKRGAGRPPVGEDIIKDSDGNVYISNCMTVEPQNIPDGVEYVNVQTDDGVEIWYKKSKPASRKSAHKYKIVNGKLVDEGASGRGRPAKGYTKVETDRVVDGVNLKGHFLFSEEDVEVALPVDDFEDVEVHDEEEARAAADAMADIQAETGEAFEDIDEEEYEEVV